MRSLKLSPRWLRRRDSRAVAITGMEHLQLGIGLAARISPSPFKGAKNQIHTAVFGRREERGGREEDRRGETLDVNDRHQLLPYK